MEKVLKSCVFMFLYKRAGFSDFPSFLSAILSSHSLIHNTHTTPHISLRMTSALQPSHEGVSTTHVQQFPVEAMKQQQQKQKQKQKQAVPSVQGTKNPEESEQQESGMY